MSGGRSRTPSTTAPNVANSERGEFGEAVPAISYVWQTPVRRPKKQPWDGAGGSSGGHAWPPAVRQKLERIVDGAPEVMVKITGRTKGVEHLLSHLEYITRNGELTAETEQGDQLAGREGLRDLQARWLDDVTLDRHRRSDATFSVNLILSMPPGTDAIKVRDSVRAFALDAFEGRHDYAFVLHQDDAHPHVHLTVRSLGHDGRRLNPRKADLHQWRETFAAELRLRGVSAEATPRRARGRVRKAERGPVRAIRKRGETPRVDRLAREAIVRDARGEGTSDRPWEARTLERQRSIRSRYQTAIDDFTRSTDPADHALATRLATFMEAMPALTLRRHELKQELADLAERQRAVEGPDRSDQSSRDKPSEKER